MKKKWYIREAETVTHYWEYEIEADTESEAEDIVRNGDVKPYNHYDEYALGNQPNPEIIEVSLIDEE